MNLISTNQFCKQHVFLFVCLKAAEMRHVAGCSRVRMFELNKSGRYLFAVARIPELKKSDRWFVNTLWISQDKRY